MAIVRTGISTYIIKVHNKYLLSPVFTFIHCKMSKGQDAKVSSILANEEVQGAFKTQLVGSVVFYGLFHSEHT